MDGTARILILGSPILGVGALAAGLGKLAYDHWGRKSVPVVPDKPACEAFAKAPEHHVIDQDSYDTINYLWPTSVAQAHTENWQPRASLYLGAAKELFRPLCALKGKNAEAAVAAYRKSVAEFLEAHYKEKPRNASEDGVLVLLGALAPANLDQETFFKALDALGEARPPQETHFRNLLKAAYFFNKAADLAELDTRFSAPKCKPKGWRMFRDEYRTSLGHEKYAWDSKRKKVRDYLQASETMLRQVNQMAMTEMQRDLLTAIENAKQTLNKSIKARMAYGLFD